ncbi:MAG: hypothetical protein ACFCVH_15330 [Alphaproteobacteria bacterium]
MKLSFSLKTAALATAAAVTAGMSATTAFADDAFQGCQEIHWSTFGEAVASSDAAQVRQFLDMHGPACEPLQRTAEVLLCSLDPAVCLATIEPAAGEPEVPEVYEPEYDVFYRAPGQHLGRENDRSDNSSPGPSSSAPSGGSTPSSSAPSESRSTDSSPSSVAH